VKDGSGGHQLGSVGNGGVSGVRGGVGECLAEVS